VTSEERKRGEELTVVEESSGMGSFRYLKEGEWGSGAVTA